ncbi:MAG: von Willebrand factor type A domain-containing protein [Bacteroidales bacterium]|nr:von Willebrand factor type A domain-containing protein [Bacteroidales bacterium]
MKRITSIAILALALVGCSKGYYSPYSPDVTNKEAVYAAADGALDSVDPGEQQEGDSFEEIEENPFIKVADQPVSTFSIDADGASYAYTRRCLKNNRLPSPSAIRTEEFLNYFTFDYTEPTGDESVAINAEIGDCPWNASHKLLRLGLNGKSLSGEVPPANYIFLIDTSGSMYGEDRIELLKSGLCNMLDYLRPVDRVAIITYSGSVSMPLESTLVKDPAAIKKIIRKLEASGSTAGGAAMKMAYDEASEHYMKDGNNRIIMCTDGDFNVGVSSTEALVKMVESYQAKGIYLSIMGFGTGNYQDSRMESLSNHGNGTYTYIDCENEMMKVFVHERSHFYSVANDTKCQLTFTDAVDSYRLIGYENRVMNNEDFEDDKKDAGEIGAGQTVTAIYELIPAEGYAADAVTATFDVRYKKALGEESRPLKLNVSVPKAEYVSSPEFNFAAGITAFTLVLKDSEYKGSASYEMASELVAKGSENVSDPLKLRKELADLIRAAAKVQQ